MAKVSTVSAVNTNEIVGLPLPVAKPVSLAQVKAHFAPCFGKDVFKEIKALGDKALGLESIIQGFTGFALHKAHSGIGDKDTIALRMASLIEHKADKSVTSRSQKWHDACVIVLSVGCKSLKDSCDIVAYEELASSVKEQLTELLLAAPARELAKKREKAAAEKAAAEKAAAEKAAPAPAPAPASSEADDAITFEVIVNLLGRFTHDQLATLQGAIARQMASVPPM